MSNWIYQRASKNTLPERRLQARLGDNIFPSQRCRILFCQHKMVNLERFVKWLDRITLCRLLPKVGFVG